MRIYQAEKEAGINIHLNGVGNSSVLVTAQAKVGDIDKYSDGAFAANLTESTVQTVEELLGRDQPDLALIVSILVSTGWNLNDDIFTPGEVWKARLSPLHKPMNDNHMAEKILGHIVQTRVLDKIGDELTISDDNNLPAEFDIEVAGVLYRAYPELSERIDEIIVKAKAGEMFVSMEAWFPDFGYGFIDPKTGDTKIVDRTEATAFLTKHLRVYGGCGEYQGYKIGRVLKDIIFGAQGFVDKPANPESIIKVAAEEVAASRVFVTAELGKLLEGGVEDMDAKESKELQTKLDETQANLEIKEKEVIELQKAVEAFKAKDYDGQIAVLTEKVDGLTASRDCEIANVTETSEKMKVMETEKAELQGKLDEMTQRAEKSDAELEGIRKTEMARDRLAKLSEIKTIEDEEATLAELREMTDDTFAVVLKYAGTNKSDTENREVKGDTEQDQANAALNTVKPTDNGADFNAGGDAKESEKEQWISTAHVLLNRTEEKNEGGE